MKCVVEISPSHYVSYMFVDLIGENRRLNLVCMRPFAKKGILFLSIDISVNVSSMDNGLLPHNLKSPKT